MLQVTGITPFVLVPNLKEAIAFYEGIGFECTFLGEENGYAYMRCDGGAVRLLEVDTPEAKAAMRQHMVYIDVPSADQFWAHHQAFLESLPEGTARAPFDQPYMQREVHIYDPGGTILMFGHDIRPT